MSKAQGTGDTLGGGLDLLLQAKAPDQQPLPMLEVICDRLAPAIATGMRHLAAERIEIRLEGVEVGRFGEVMTAMPSPSVFGVFQVAPLDGAGIMVLEPEVIDVLLEALMGGKTGEPGASMAGTRGFFTRLETGLMSSFMTMSLAELARAFAVVTPVTVDLQRCELLPRFAAVVEPAVATAQCRFRVDMDGRSGRFHLLLPTTTLEPVREKLTQRLLGSPLRGNAAWSAHFESEIRRMPLRLEAVLAERTLQLHEIVRWKVGETVPLGQAPNTPVTLQLEGVPLARAEMGQRDERVSLRLLDGLFTHP